MGICQSKTENKYESSKKREAIKEDNKKVNNQIKIEVNNTNKRKKIFTGHSFIPIEITTKVLKSVCKIKIKKNGGKDYECGTGFFMNINNDSKKYLITNYHVISEKIINEDIEIEIHNHKTMNLKLNNRYTKYFPEPKDISIIEIKKTDEIYDDIELLDYDMVPNKGYNTYKNSDVFSIEYPYGTNAVDASGQIKDIEDFEFEHTIPTDYGSSGSPIILLFTNNINLIKVIGIHKEADNSKQINVGTFIGEIFKENNGNLLKNEIKDNSSKNEIICIYNKQQDEISLLHHYNHIYDEEDMKYYIEGKNNINGNNIEIYINNKKIKFNYKYKSKEKGEIKVKFIFNKLLTSTFLMFYGCYSLQSIDLSSFNTTNVNNMLGMFNQCSSLQSIDLSSFNTTNVKDMSLMFYKCSSLQSLDLSSFNTTNVKKMWMMFYDCSSLQSLDLSSFNTTNVDNMYGMFCNCSSLISINLSSFNTTNVKYMNDMFAGCSSLKSIDLSSFNTTNVNNMYGMFGGCSSLISINLSSFNTTNVNNMEYMFINCPSLKKENAKINDYKILSQLNEDLKNN